jgi:O-succinylbenzoic acid--CoA ligase
MHPHEPAIGHPSGQNRVVIEWLHRVDPDLPFLQAAERSWTYGQAVEEVESRLTALPRLIQPSLRSASVFDIIAGIAGGGATVVGPEPEVTGPGDAELVVFTSGTTGPPKGVRLTMLNLTAAASASAEHLGHGQEDNWLLAMPLHHVGGISIIVRQAYSGGSITLLPRFEANAVVETMRGPVTMVSVVPTMLARLLEHGPYHGLRAVLVGGGPIRDGLLEAASARGLPVLPTYGMTETFGQVATLRPGSPLERKVHPLPGVEIRTDPNGRIAVKSTQVSPGYVGRPDRGDPWFVTNDLGEIDESGALRILGRADTVIVTGGENVDPERVEAVLREHPGVEEAVVVGLPDAEWGHLVVCVYTGDADRPGDWASETLPRFMVPKRWIRTETIPRTPIGKPDRAAVRALAEQVADRRVEDEVESQADRHRSE